MFPVFGKRVYTEILPLEWMEFLRGMEQKGIIEQMGRVRAFCKEIYDLARVTGRAVHNPLEGLSKFLQSRSAENYAHVSIEELPALLPLTGLLKIVDTKIGKNTAIQKLTITAIKAEMGLIEHKLKKL